MSKKEFWAFRLVFREQQSLSKFLYGDLTLLNQYYQITKNSAHKTQFSINQASHFNLLNEDLRTIVTRYE